MKIAGSSRPPGPIGLLALILGSVPLAHAAPAATAPSPAQASAGALGQNLDYLRVRDVPAGLASARPAATGALVLDLRFALAGADGGNALTTWLRGRARASAPVLVLFNAATAQDLIGALSPAALPPGVVTLAPAGASLPADVLVNVDPATDRAGYDAFANGTALGNLVSPATDKPRFDESELMRRDAEENATGKAAAPKAAPAPGNGGRGGPPGRRGGPPSRPPVVDPMLQRAVQFHRTLLALGRVK
jgi:hypothetical protein